MAAIPDVTAFSQAGPQPDTSVAAYEPPNWRQVGMAGDVLSNAGRTVQDAANTISQSNERQDDMVALAAGNQLASRRITLQSDPDAGFTNVKGIGAVGPQFVNGYLEKFDQAATDIRSSLQSGYQQRVFDQHAQLQRLQFQQGLLEYQSRQTDAFNDATTNDTISLNLRSMSQRPFDEVGFQTGLTQINGVLDAYGERKGLAPQAVAALKAQNFDAAYSTRILSVANGIPGVVQANPYLAEKMFDQVQDQLGPQAQVRLGEEVQNAIKPVQQRDIANATLNGVPPVLPAQVAPAVGDAPPLTGVVKSLEGSGPDSVSPKGAQGVMQVMPGTAANPGYGVAPAQLGADGKPLPGELDRVGRDYLGAMTARYQNPVLILAAYNAGPGVVDDWIQGTNTSGKNPSRVMLGDPRAGQASVADWAAKIPFAETRDYVERGLQKVGTTPQGTPTPLTPAQMKTQLPALMQQARDAWTQLYPNDPVGADAVAARVASYGTLQVNAQEAQQKAAADVLTNSLLGPNGDGKGAPQTIDQAIADPQVQQAWQTASPETKEAYLHRLATGDKQFTQDSMHQYYDLLSLAGNNPEQFAKLDLALYFGKVPDAQLLSLMTAQKSIDAKDVAQQQKNLNWTRAVAQVDDMLKPLGMGKSAKVGTAQEKLSGQFYGRFNSALTNWHDQNNSRWPDETTTRQIATGLLAEGAVSGGFLWDSSERYFQALDEGNASKFYVPLPSARTPERTSLIQSFQKVAGRAPSDDELQRWYTQYKLSGGQ